MQDLGTLGGHDSWGNAISADGAAVAGGAQMSNGLQHAFLWKDNIMQDLGTLGSANESVANAMSADGRSIVGKSFTYATQNDHAFMYTQELGMIDLNTYLPSLGVDLRGWTLVDALAISSDGTAVTVYCTHNGANGAFIIRGIPSSTAFSVLAIGSYLTVRRRHAA